MRIVLIIFFCLQSFIMPAQKLWDADIGVSGTYTSNGQVPFWFRSNKFGSVPPDGASASLIGSFHIKYDSMENKLLDWGMGVEGRLNTGPGNDLLLIEAYAKAKLSIFEVKAGRSKDIVGFTGDSLLSAGAFSFSGNTLGIPKVEISIPEYFSIPVWDGLFSFKGNFAHGWVGDIPIQYNIAGANSSTANTYLHQKSFYGRLGKPSWRFKLYAGFNHNAFWGNEKNAFGRNATLSAFETFKYVMLGKADQQSKVGNHLGSIDVGFQYRFGETLVTLYRQNFYDVGGLYYLSNIADGLNGLSFSNLGKGNSTFRWNRLLFEFLYTKNQGGYPWSRITPSGDEDYYNNYIYTEGWSYKGEGLGNPFITPQKYARKDLPAYPRDYFINHRVVAFHTGVEGSFKGFNFLGKFSYSKNYGTFGTSRYGHSTGEIREKPPAVLFPVVNQISAYAEITKQLNNDYFISAAAAIDAGKLYYNSSGVSLSVKKSF